MATVPGLRQPRVHPWVPPSSAPGILHNSRRGHKATSYHAMSRAPRSERLGQASGHTGKARGRASPVTDGK